MTSIHTPFGRQIKGTFCLACLFAAVFFAANTALAQTAAPAFSPGAGAYFNTQIVTITPATSGASIRYTTDGSTPTETKGTVYSSPVDVSITTTLQAIAYKNGADSLIASSSYTIDHLRPQTAGPTTAAPTFSPSAGTYASGQTVTITSTTSGATIRYTTDGSTPSQTNGTPYSGPISFNSSTRLNAIAYETSFTDSAVTSGLFSITSSPAATLNVLSNCTSFNDLPSSLMQGSDGNFYGTSESGGSSFYDGTVFSITTAGVLTTLVSFNGANGDLPFGALIQGHDGNFYGTTESGGSANDGTVFQMTPAGVLTTLFMFTSTSGSQPEGPLVQGGDGNFYGTTAYGSSASVGTAFMMTPAGSLTSLVSFTGPNGGGPGALVQGSDGNFYGTTFNGGSGFNGTIFKMTTAGILTTLVSFTGTNGGGPNSLVQASDGNFYGTAFYGGSPNDNGTVFMMTPAGVLTTLFTFTGTNGGEPVNLTQGGDGNFYGMTRAGGSAHDGTIFKMTPAGVLTTLVSFSGANGNLGTALIQGRDGNFYGTTSNGGSSDLGVIFQLTLPPAPAMGPIFNPAAGTYTSAQNVTITSATSGASIAYTTDGSVPIESGGTITHGTLYTGPVSISATTTLSAIAFKTGMTDSSVSTGIFTIQTSTSNSSPGSGGGGALDYWFLSALALSGLFRWKSRPSRT